MRRTVRGIVLAAGNGSRMGRTKQLIPFRGKTVIECVVDAALSSGLDGVTVVLGHDAERIRQVLGLRDLSFVVNPDHAQGQGTSTSAGIRALPPEADAALFLLGDQPLVTPGVIDRVLQAYRESEAPIVMPTFEGRRGNPVLFGRETFEGLRALPPGGTARALFDAFAAQVQRVEVGDPAIHFDIDTEADYQRLLREHPR